MNDIEKKIEALKAEFLGKLEELKKEAEMQKKQEEWKFGEKYFYISQSGRVICEVFTEHRTDIARKNFGNFFRTRERAEQVKEKMRLLLRLEQLHDMLCPDYVPDWNNDGELKFCLGYDHADDCWLADDFNVTQYPTVYFDTNENVEKAAEILNKEMRESK
jgi:hypothetical protein|nr:MAG TPA: hypothetical protein [Caudoviricetes sp.]